MKGVDLRPHLQLRVDEWNDVILAPQLGVIMFPPPMPTSCTLHHYPRIFVRQLSTLNRYDVEAGTSRRDVAHCGPA